MGNLTTFTIYNDGAHLLDPSKPENERHIRELAAAVYTAALGIPQRTKEYSFPIGGFTNMVAAQETRHADDHTLYVHMGNCVTELNAYSHRTRDLFRQHPNFAKNLLRFLKDEVKALSKLEIGKD